MKYFIDIYFMYCYDIFVEKKIKNFFLYYKILVFVYFIMIVCINNIGVDLVKFDKF